MSNGEVIKVSPEQLNIVQNYIEQCITKHMTLNEMKNTLLVKASIRPELTEFAWKHLEQLNPEFFKAYHFRLLVKDQIVKFNRLLERQAELMRDLSIKPPNMSNGSDIQKNMLMTHSSNMGLVHGMNGEMMKPEPGDINGSHFVFGSNGELVDASHAAVEMPVSSYSSVECQPQPINNSTLAGANAVHENVGQIPRSLSHSDLTANFSLSSDILEGHSESPFLAAGSNSLLNPQYLVEQQDNRRLDTISEGLSYDNFGSNFEISNKKKSE